MPSVGCTGWRIASPGWNGRGCSSTPSGRTSTFEDDITVILSRNGAGWHHLLDKLASALDGRTLAWSQQDQQVLQDRYAAMLPPA